jgi:hypothetical protein
MNEIKNQEEVSQELELQKKQQQERIKGMIKYSFELKKIGLIDSLRQNIASELVDDYEIEKEIKTIYNIIKQYLLHFERLKEITETDEQLNKERKARGENFGL